ncbi:MAG: XRE family transcriptional regulator [Desulfobacterales bacterium]|nr:XRE family transcriptional regulator [Desulfobacterales bacterium]
MLPENEIGQNIKRMRKTKKLTLEYVAEKSGFSKGYLSKLENSDKAPPVSTLVNIASALNVSVSEILGETMDVAPSLSLVKKNERPVMALDGTRFGYSYEPLAYNFPSKRMHPYILTIPKDIEKIPLFEHKGEEIFMVQEGKVNFFHGNKEYELEEGDCIYFDASFPHRGFAVDCDEAKCLIVIYKP